MKSLSPYYIAKVVEQFPEEDTIDVVFIRNNHLAERVKVLHSRANPLYGYSGNLPDVGEIGLVLHAVAYGEEYFWIGSYHDSCDSICTKESDEIGRKLFHHESDVYHQILADGTVEFSHPSGTFIKLGNNTTLKARKRFRRLEGTFNERIVESYPNRQASPIKLTLNHTWCESAMSSQTYSTDARKQSVSGDLKHTNLLMDEVGNVTLDHETANHTHMKITIEPNGNTTIYSDLVTIRGISGDTIVEVVGSIHATKFIKSDTDVIGNMVYDVNGDKSMLGMRSDYNPHHHGDSGPPDPSM